MASLNPLTREVVFKIVFYGPGLGGKTTTLQHIHAASKPEHRGKMVSLATPMDRTLYFDFLPLRVPLLQGMHVRLQLFTVPGQVYFGATRKLVLTGADGVVFVADSQSGRQDANEEALEDLIFNLAENNLALLGMPHTFHWNKRDLPDIVPMPELDRTLNRQGAPSIGTVATRGDGVFAGLERITRLVFHAYEAELPRSEPEPLERVSVERAVIEETTIGDALRELAEAPLRARATPTDGVASPSPPPAVSSLESIPNPIPRRPTGSFDPVPGSSPSPSTPSVSATAALPPSRGPLPSSKYALGRLSTPAPTSETGEAASKPASSRPALPLPPAPETGPAKAQAKTVERVAATLALGGPASVSVSAGSSGPKIGSNRSPKDEVNGEATFSFGPLWADADREAAKQAESLLAEGDPAGALLVCDVLVTRLLAAAAGLGGNAEAPRDPSHVVLLLGLDGRRYLSFRAKVRAARSAPGKGSRDVREAKDSTSPLSVSDALEAYSFSLEVRRALAFAAAR